MWSASSKENGPRKHTVAGASRPCESTGEHGRDARATGQTSLTCGLIGIDRAKSDRSSKVRNAQTLVARDEGLLFWLESVEMNFVWSLLRSPERGRIGSRACPLAGEVMSHFGPRSVKTREAFHVYRIRHCGSLDSKARENRLFMVC